MSLADPSGTMSLAERWLSLRKCPDAANREYLAGHYLDLAKAIAAKSYGQRPDQTVPFEDYLQWARLGLLESIERFDPARGVSFETFAFYRIRGSILNGVARGSELAAQRRSRRERMRARRDDLVSTLIPRPRQAALGQFVELVMSLTMGALLDDAHNVVDENVQANPYSAVELIQVIKRMSTLVDTLPPKELQVIRGHYFHELEFKQIAAEMRLSKGRISQLHAQALARMLVAFNERPSVDRKL